MLDIKRSATQNSHVYILTVIYKSHGNHKPKTSNKYTKKRKEFKHNIKDSHEITREKNKRKEINNHKATPKQWTKWQ